MQEAIARAREAYLHFRTVPAPQRGEILRQVREALSRKVGSDSASFYSIIADCLNSDQFNPASQRDELGALVSLEMGKIRTEGEGEVQEFIDIVWQCKLKLPPL